MRKKLIVFLGIDGAGKSTLTNLITNELNEKHGFRVKRFWFRSKIQIYLSSILNKLKNKSFKNNKSKIEFNNKTKYTRKFISELYLYMVLLDYFAISILFIKIPLLLGRNVVCDRYIYDVILDLACDFNYSEEKIRSLINSKLFIEPDIIYLINVPIDLAKNRRPEHSTKELISKIKALEKFKKYNSINSKIIELNGAEKLPVIFGKIENSLLETVL